MSDKKISPSSPTTEPSPKRRHYVVAGAVLLALASAAALWLYSRGPGPIPPLIHETGEEGVPVARLDQPRLTEWCRASGLPDPPGIGPLQPEVAEKLLEALRLASEEGTAEAYGEVGQIFESLDAHGSAAAYFRMAEAEDPTEFRWPYHLGCVHQEAGDQGPAIEALERALAANQEYPTTYARLGQLYLESGRLEESRQMHERYTELHPEDWLGLVGLGRVALQSGDFEEALDHLEAAASIQADDFQVQHNLGRAHAGLGNREQAQEHYDRASKLPQGGWFLARDPLAQDLQRSAESAASLMREFEELSASGNWPRLAYLAEEIVRRRPNDTTMLSNLASIYRKMDRDEDALETISRALELRPDSIRLNVVLAEILLSQQKYDEAVAAAGRTLGIDADNPRALAVLGRALYQSKRHEEAEVALRRYAEIVPGDVVNLYLLGESLLALGRRDEAVAILEEVVERQPGFRHAKARLVQLEVLDQAQAEAAGSTPDDPGAVE